MSQETKKRRVHVSVEPQLEASIMEYDTNGQETYR